MTRLALKVSDYIDDAANKNVSRESQAEGILRKTSKRAVVQQRLGMAKKKKKKQSLYVNPQKPLKEQLKELEALNDDPVYDPRKVIPRTRSRPKEERPPVSSDEKGMFDDDEEEDEDTAALRRLDDLKLVLKEASNSLSNGIKSTEQQIRTLRDYLQGPEFRDYKNIRTEHREHISDICCFGLWRAIREMKDAIEILEKEGAQTTGRLSLKIESMMLAIDTINQQRRDIEKQIKIPTTSKLKTYNALLDCTKTVSECQEELLDQHPHLEMAINKLTVDQLFIKRNSIE